MAGGEKWSVPQWDKEEAPAILLWYHGRSMGVPWCPHGTPERQGALWIVGIGSRPSAFRECDLD